MVKRDVGRMGYERWIVLELGDQATSSHLNDEASLSAGVLVRARTAHEAAPLAFQDAPANVEALPNASLIHRGIIVLEHVMLELGSCIPAALTRPLFCEA